MNAGQPAATEDKTLEDTAETQRGTAATDNSRAGKRMVEEKYLADHADREIRRAILSLV